jgi:hypothetical protein
MMVGFPGQADMMTYGPSNSTDKRFPAPSRTQALGRKYCRPERHEMTNTEVPQWRFGGSGG